MRKLVQSARPSFTLDNGEVVAMAALGLLGRNPYAELGESHAQLIAVPDTTRTVSKTHLAYGADGGEIWVMDRHSTNGTTVIAADGRRTSCQPGVRTTVLPGQTVQFGDRTLVVHATK
jgi:pSer/pThr/pTyr-binding forkhead associated (FHA) protein